MIKSKIFIATIFGVYLFLLVACSSKERSDLILCIKNEQKKHVRDSRGIEEDQCFTDADYAAFQRENKAAAIIERLKNDNNFRGIVDSIRVMAPEARSNLLDSARRTYRRPWLELGIDPDPPRDELLSGQTAAGSRAEKDIADSIVNLVVSMLK